MIATLFASLLFAGTLFFTLAASESEPSTSIDRFHPGRTDGSGCHTCRTNCGRWGLSYGEYHCHRPVSPTRTPTPSPTRAPTRSPTRTSVPARTTTLPRISVPPSEKLTNVDLSNSRSVISRPLNEIANTGGIGIALRGSCADRARTTLGWPEGQRVVVFAQGTGPCAGWSVVGAGGSHTWVRDQYLKVRTPPPAPAASAPVAGSSGLAIDQSNSRSPAARPITAIANTGGLGIALRGSCIDSARTTLAWPENKKVVLVSEGTGPCVGWSVVEAGGWRTWVRNRYLEAFGSAS